MQNSNAIMHNDSLLGLFQKYTIWSGILYTNVQKLILYRMQNIRSNMSFKGEYARVHRRRRLYSFYVFLWFLHLHARLFSGTLADSLLHWLRLSDNQTESLVLDKLR